VGLVRFLDYDRRFFVVVLTLRKALPRVARLLVGVLPLFLAFALLGVALFGADVDDFRSLGQSCITLFAVLNGDVIRDTFTALTQVHNVAGQVYLYIFVSLFIYVVLNVLLAVAEEAFYSTVQRSAELLKEEKSMQERARKAREKARARAVAARARRQKAREDAQARADEASLIRRQVLMRQAATAGAFAPGRGAADIDEGSDDEAPGMLLRNSSMRSACPPTGSPRRFGTSPVVGVGDSLEDDEDDDDDDGVIVRAASEGAHVHASRGNGGGSRGRVAGAVLRKRKSHNGKGKSRRVSTRQALRGRVDVLALPARVDSHSVQAYAAMARLGVGAGGDGGDGGGGGEGSGAAGSASADAGAGDEEAGGDDDDEEEAGPGEQGLLQVRRQLGSLGVLLYLQEWDDVLVRAIRRKVRRRRQRAGLAGSGIDPAVELEVEYATRGAVLGGLSRGRAPARK